MRPNSLFNRRCQQRTRHFNFCGNMRNFTGFSQNVLTIRVKNLTAESVPVNLFKDVDQSKVMVSTTGGNYGGLQRSIVATPFAIKDFKVLTKTRDQLDEPIRFLYSDFLGETHQTTIIPSSFSSAMNRIPTEIDTLGTGMIVNINSSIEFTLLPNEQVTIIMRLGEVHKQFKNFWNTIDPDAQYTLQRVFRDGRTVALHYVQAPVPGQYQIEM